MFANRVLPTTLVVLVLAAAAAITTLKHTFNLTAGTTAAPPVAAAVSGVVRACPAPGLVGSPAARVALIAAPGASGGSAGSGQSVITPFGVTGAHPLVALGQPGALTLAKVKAAPPPKHPAKPSPAPSGQTVATQPTQGGVVIAATGSMARGLEAEQVTNSGSSGTRCDSPGTDFWFVGPGKFSLHSIQLYLMNPGGQPADVNVEAFTDAGPLQGSTDTGVAVAPHSMVVQSLGTMLKGSRVVALHVRTSVGQVAAALHENTGKTGGGAWLPAAQPPADRVVVPGLPDTAGTRQLFVTVPGTQDAHITLTAITSRGSYQPTGGSGLDIPGGSSVSISLPSLAGVPGAIKVAANVPVTATAMLPGGPAGAPGIFTSAYPPIQEQGVVAENLTGGGRIAQLVLSAPLQAASARITEVAVGQGGKPQPASAGKVVKVRAKHTLVVQLSRAPGSPRGSAFAVLITPVAGSGPLYAGRVLAGTGQGGALQSILPVPSAITTVPLPIVRDAPITPGR
jgi:hypothetical protein